MQKEDELCTHVTVLPDKNGSKSKYLFCLVELYLDGVFNFAPFVSKQSNKYRHLAVKIEMAKMFLIVTEQADFL